MTAARRLRTAAAAIPLVAAVMFTPGQVWFVCRGDSVARHACCCPKTSPPAATDSRPTVALRSGCCCDISKSEGSANPGVTTSREIAPQITKVTTTLAIQAFVFPSPRATVHPSESARPPPLGIPLLLQKRSLLI